MIIFAGLLMTTSLLSSCSSLRTRNELDKAASSQHGLTGSNEPNSKSDGVGGVNSGTVVAPGESQFALPSSPSTSSSTSSTSQLLPQQQDQQLQQLQQQQLQQQQLRRQNTNPVRLGLILGPGALKTYAHIGVLKELGRARIPVHSIIGLEWGALMAGLYAVQGQASDLEWKAFKLREDDLPARQGLLNKSIQPEAIGNGFRRFLKDVFAQQMNENTKLSFACPVYSMKLQKMGWMKKGALRDTMLRCVSYPPYFTFSEPDAWGAAPMAIEEAAQILRSRGANVIVLVDVLYQSKLVVQPDAHNHNDSDYINQVLWSEIQYHSSLFSFAHASIQSVIQVPTGDVTLTDYAARRALVETGVQAAKSWLQKASQQWPL